jgi:Lon protease-like protein
MFELPLFPLNTVLFPGMPLRLHIFEERYRLMIKRVIETNQTFGVNLIKKGAEAFGPVAEPFEIGCTARVVQVEQLDDGRINLTVVGDERFHVLRLGNSDPYLTAFVESMPLNAHHTLDVVRGARVLRDRLLRYLDLLARHSESGEPGEELELDFDINHIDLPEDPMMLIYLSAALLQVPANEKQSLLEANTAAALLEQVQRLYRRELAVLPPLMEVDEEAARNAAWTN